MWNSNKGRKTLAVQPFLPSTFSWEKLAPLATWAWSAMHTKTGAARRVLRDKNANSHILVNPDLRDQLLRALTNKDNNLFMLGSMFWLAQHFHVIASAWVLAGLGVVLASWRADAASERDTYLPPKPRSPKEAPGNKKYIKHVFHKSSISDSLKMSALYQKLRSLTARGQNSDPCTGIVGIYPMPTILPTC